MLLAKIIVLGAAISYSSILFPLISFLAKFTAR
jgi:hypothetical protein